MIRAAIESDLAHLQRLETEADALLVERLDAQEWPPAMDGAERAASPGFLLVAAREGGAPIGFVHVLEVDGLAHLEQVSVPSSHGRRGVGRSLVAAAQHEVRDRGHDRLTLRTYADVPWNAPFYARLGFVESDPDAPFLVALVGVEERLGLDRYGRRIQMTAELRSSGVDPPL